jgi:3-hydroxyacyl-CoA dehydrogenase
VLFSTRVESCYDSNLIFEAIVEDVDLKVKIFKQILANNPNQPWFLTNTSSIPIGELDTKADMKGSIIGFHFYNPPAVQKLVELITTPTTNKELVNFSNAYAKSIGKIVVPSNDFAGFIGNGHFMRDLLFAVSQSEGLSSEFSLLEAIYAVNRVSQDFLIRPMGIFQLIDYVGVDVCQKILRVMSSRLSDPSLHSKLIDTLIEQGVKGGQNNDGSQKDGILQYEKGRPIAVWDTQIQCYSHFNTFMDKVDQKLGPLPSSHSPWKVVIGNRQREDYLVGYFKELKSMNTFGAKLAMDYHAKSNNIGLELVGNGIADNPENVNTVMLTGFFHAYGPINSYLD